ncbi:MAG TPA: HesA/MoeB/ThiF family protein [Elusimicrobiota bacterium]|nr:HesA/MoeB/ThiF family protein [Elusimicrobiota bacterium]
MTLSALEEKIYARQILIPEWGLKAQKRLKSAEVFIAGAGGLGSPASIYLTVAGVGHLVVCDFDSPDWTNLNRQILHDPSRIGVNKALSARKTLERLNAHVRISDISEKITAESVDRLVGEAEVIVDCMDNFETRYVLNDCAIRKHIPLAHGSIRGMEGRLTFLWPPETPCLRCLIPEAPPREVFPVIGAAPGVIGTLQALEVLKYLAGVGKTLMNRLLVWDGEYAEFQTLNIRRDPACPACGPLHLKQAAPAPTRTAVR